MDFGAPGAGPGNHFSCVFAVSQQPCSTELDFYESTGSGRSPFRLFRRRIYRTANAPDYQHLEAQSAAPEAVSSISWPWSPFRSAASFDSCMSWCLGYLGNTAVMSSTELSTEARVSALLPHRCAGEYHRLITTWRCSQYSQLSF